MKIDVEGYEDDVIYGSLKILNMKRIKYIFFEYNNFIIVDIMIDGARQNYYLLINS